MIQHHPWTRTVVCLLALTFLVGAGALAAAPETSAPSDEVPAAEVTPSPELEAPPLTVEALEALATAEPASFTLCPAGRCGGTIFACCQPGGGVCSGYDGVNACSGYCICY